MTKNKNKLSGYTAICLYSILSGVSFAWTKRLLENSFPVFTIVTVRLLIGALFLLGVLAATKRLEPLKRKDFPAFLCLALGEPFVYFIGEDFGMQHVEASFASVVIALIPVLVAFAIPLVYGGRIKLSLVLGAALSLCGIALMSFTSAGFSFNLKGLSLLLLALIAAVWYNVFLQRLLKTYGAFSVTAYMNIIGAVMYLPLFFAFDASHVCSLDWSVANVVCLVCLGVLCSAGSYGLYSFGASRLGVEKVSIFNNAAPVVTVFAAVLMHMETLSVQKLLGVVIVVCGVIFSQGLFDKKQKSV
ncbi:MAG: DMT family transporter [Bacteroidales bacterium]|nr:DMT family transporter [Bacteroidales bacterium]